MNVLAHNLTAMNAQRMYSVNARLQSKTSEKLSSGYKINRSADDAAGLSISEKMRRQVRGLTQASANAQDGISMVQIADGALTEVHDMLQRGNELVIKAANGTLSDSDREDINKELVQLKAAIDQISTNTKFNELEVFPATGVAPELASTSVVNSYELELGPDGVASVKHLTQGEGVGSASAINTGNALADKIAGEFVPNAVNQILDKFGSLKDEINKYADDDADKLKMALDIKYVDGPGGTLAYVKASFKKADQTLAKMSLTVDSADFTEDDVKNDTSKMGTLESTIAHEMMHAVMDAAMPSRMYGKDGGTEDFPHWYVEGSAQLAGGGYTTGWNDQLQAIVKDTGTSDAQKKDKITNYLKAAGTVDSREYGHGYLAAAYLGHLISGETGDVSADSIAKGTDDLFKELLKDENKDKSFEEVVNSLLTGGMTLQKVKDAINTGSNGGADFVLAFTRQSLNGAGSVIASGGLSAAAKEVLGDSADSSPIYIDPDSIRIENLNKAPASGLYDVLIQAGSESDVSNKIHFSLFRMTAKDLGLDSIGVTPPETEEETDVRHAMLTEEGATEAIDLFKMAINLVSGVRSYYGAVQNRMEHTIKNLDNVVENTTASEARLRDTDMAAEMVKYAKDNILLQAGQSMMAQANQSNAGIMTLL